MTRLWTAPYRAVSLLRRSGLTLANAERAGAPGTAFARFGRQVGRKLLQRGARTGWAYLITPVSIVRYFEFQFALEALPAACDACADAGSPRLFSLYVAHAARVGSVLVVNPDRHDADLTGTAAAALRLRNVRVASVALDALVDHGPFDCIWSLSVVEHVSGAYDDRAAMRLLVSALKPGGRLIVTVPVDRAFREEYRGEDVYGLGGARGPEGHLFQRFYDLHALRERLVAGAGIEPTAWRWFGERERGRFLAYERRWKSEGHACTVDDPVEIAAHYHEYARWDQMPGIGVAGLVFDRPR